MPLKLRNSICPALRSAAYWLGETAGVLATTPSATLPLVEDYPQSLTAEDGGTTAAITKHSESQTNFSWKKSAIPRT
jgi:hypothetical protein